jgi:glycosyltransferase involved in cell wall biosynthesis
MLDNGEKVVTFTYRPEFRAPAGGPSQNPMHYFIDKDIYPTGILRKISAVIGVFYEPRILKDLEKIIRKEKPVIAHIHNVYHRFPYGIIDVLRKHGVKTIWWLHDYKWICPNHQLFTQGKTCMRCNRKNYLQAIVRRCQVHSLSKSMIACLFAYFVYWNRYNKRIDCFIAPSRSAFSQYTRFDFPVSKICVLHHFNPVTVEVIKKPSAAERPEEPYALYAGRLEENKGLDHLVRAFGGAGYRLRIVGAGNYERILKKYCSDNRFTSIDFAGYVPPENLPDYFLKSLFIVVPSVWYEVFGLAIVESFNYAKPVVAADIGAIPEIVEDGKSGLLYRSGDAEDLRGKVRWMFEHPEPVKQMGLYAWKSVQQKFSPENYWKELNSLHASLMTVREPDPYK